MSRGHLRRASTSFDHLPAAIRVLLPEVDTLAWPAEQHADCSSCPMTKAPARPWQFSAETRCCTANPALVNFLAGRSLRRGEPSRGLILRRLEDPEGVSAWGIDPPAAHDDRYRSTPEAFGRDQTLRCPMWVGGEKSCGIWHDRSSTCRTWYCKHEDGLAGAVAWSRMSQALTEVESRLAIWAIECGGAPAGPASPAAWAAWFERAAALVDGATEADLAGLGTDGLVALRSQVSEFVDVRRIRRRRGLAVVLVVAISEMVRVGADVLLTGYSAYDSVRAPASVFELFNLLDGTRPWRDALAQARSVIAARGEPADWLDDALVVQLHRVGALRDPGGRDDLPFTVEMADMDRWSRAAKQVP